MARARLLKPGFFENEHLAALSLRGRLLFAGLWTLADKRGRLEDRPVRIKAALFPYEEVDLDPVLDELTASAFIIRYVADGQSLIQVTNFEKHQHTHKHEPDSVLPAPTTDIVGMATAIGGSTTGDVATCPPKAEAKAEAESEAKAEAKAENAPAPDFQYRTEPVVPDEAGFIGEYVRHHERLFGRHPGASKVADAAQLERDFGFDACMQVSQDTNWEKPPSWLRPKLEERAKKATGPPVEIGFRKQSLRYGGR